MVRPWFRPSNPIFCLGTESPAGWTLSCCHNSDRGASTPLAIGIIMDLGQICAEGVQLLRRGPADEVHHNAWKLFIAGVGGYRGNPRGGSGL